ncbi:hypothetical protein M406DRAFT_295601 [Cryphonectria parasitica EP155]|uniref:SH3 domain-containing protein n=1 Tax=Cryphonectria parasitica (strain ATCC 38755 / EP155) TaxID=660469 RepID=A0A9P4XWK2_CRYP1|nr:uncharacterized protein M406DRAFT_295601 [Cryphonectria parasitica EP155]KAF3761895.1 hypothetical protein M406DRAFT_295601 [Cryphonectria parasitica EP155]
MPAATEGPTVALSFANNFWGKEDAGVTPMLERMHAAKQTCDELRSFYNARASIEEEYARKLLSLSRKALGSQEMGTLKTSLDTLRGEVEGMGKQHQNNAAQMRSELEEPLTAFAGGMKERRKIVQNGIEKLLKTKQQQTQQVNKTRDRYEQECLKIKGYLAQGHMVMGQEERKNKAKLEKTQISLATSNQEYENAVKALEETTVRWNREWKAAADKFQDLEEERLDFTKSSLWTFANIASTVCVSDDASCEKIRLSLEKMEVEKDIIHFIRDKGTGQEIPDPPKYINFCRGDVDAQSEISEDEAYSVAQFPRSINPLFRSSSPQPSTYESHHDPTSALARELGHGVVGTPPGREQAVTSQKAPKDTSRDSREFQRQIQPPEVSDVKADEAAVNVISYEARRDCLCLASPGRLWPLLRDDRMQQITNVMQFDPNEFAPVPHDPYPMDGMTMLCRPNTHNGSDLGSQVSATSVSDRPTSRDERSDYSFSSHEPTSGAVSPVKQDPVMSPVSPAQERDRKVLKKKSGFFQNHSPFGRRKSIRDPKDLSGNSRNTWHGGNSNPGPNRQFHAGGSSQSLLADRATASPDPIDANADVAINVGDNVLPVKLPGRQKPAAEPEPQDDDPIAQALAELKGVAVNKQSTVRMSADHYHGIATPAPGAQPFSRSAPIGGPSNAAAGMRGTPPPSYDQPPQRLGVPSPAVTSRAMKETSQKYTQGTRNLFTGDRPGSGNYRSSSRPATRGNDMPRAASPAAPRSASPRPGMYQESASPNTYANSPRGSTNSRHGSVQMDNHSSQGFYRQNSPNDMPRAASPAPFRGGGDYGRPASRGDYGRPASRAGSNLSNGHPDMARGMSPAPTDDGYSGSMRGRGGRPGTSQGNRGMSLYEPQGQIAPTSRQRSKSVADSGKHYTKDGRPVLHFARAMYMYQAAIPEELGFNKGDILAVLRHQDDGWWEAEVHSANGHSGLLPVATRHRMDLVSSGAETLRSGYNATTYTAGSIWGALTSKTAQRTALTSVLLGLVSTFLLGCAAVSYLAFYHEYLPDQVTTLPVHLQYGYEVNPYGLITLADKKFGDYQDYDISVTLNLPNSPANLERGNFMLALHLLDNQPGDSSRVILPMTNPVRVLEGRNILYTSTRPAIVPYTDPLVSLASRLLFLAYHVFVPASETTRLVVPMVERLEFRPGTMMPTTLVLDVQAGQTLQVYSASVTITAQLHGLRWFMHTWWITSFLLFTALFWLWEVFSLGITILILRLIFNGHREDRKVKQEQTSQPPQKIKREGDSSGKTLDDVPMTFPTSSQQPPLRYDPEPAHTNDVTASTPQADMPPAAGVEADDEYEDAGVDAGVDEYGEDEGRDSGIGTSFSERDGPGTLRRRASGRRNDS